MIRIAVFPRDKPEELCGEITRNKRLIVNTAIRDLRYLRSEPI